MIFLWHFGSYCVLVRHIVETLLKTKHLQKQRGLHHNLSLVHKHRNLFIMCDSLFLLFQFQLLFRRFLTFTLFRQMQHLPSQSTLNKRIVRFLYLWENDRVDRITSLIAHFNFLDCYYSFGLIELQLFIIKFVLFIDLRIRNISTVQQNNLFRLRTDQWYVQMRDWYNLFTRLELLFTDSSEEEYTWVVIWLNGEEYFIDDILVYTLL